PPRSHYSHVSYTTLFRSLFCADLTGGVCLRNPVYRQDLVQLSVACFAYREDITEPRSLLETPSSQCARCTGCKRSCPDINEENGDRKSTRLNSSHGSISY